MSPEKVRSLSSANVAISEWMVVIELVAA